MKNILTPGQVEQLLYQIAECRIGVIGDFCLDTYFTIAPSQSEISIETGLPTKPVRKMHFHPGGAGNVANNLLSLGVTSVEIFGVLGNDIFGKKLRELLELKGGNTSGLLVQEDDWDTHVYIKTIENEKETGRIDFGNFNILHESTAKRLIRIISKSIAGFDIVIINQQQKNGIHTKFFRQQLQTLISANKNTKFILDSRDYPDEFPGASRKLNEEEGERVFFKNNTEEDYPPELRTPDTLAEALYGIFHEPVFLTLGEDGCIVYDESGGRRMWGLQILEEVDTVGAGDSFLAGIATAIACGCENYTASYFGNLSAGVTVKKLKQTGTASPPEIVQMSRNVDFRYRPDLAADPRKADYYNTSDIETVTFIPRKSCFSYAIFDHDGTISVLRQGWEAIMKPMMVKAILGKRYETVTTEELSRVEQKSAAFIDKTTGVQTLVQMKSLVDLVRSAGYVPENEIKDAFEYKSIYNKDLMKMVEDRVRRFQEGQRNIQDYTIKGSIDFLKTLHSRGVILFLASGTDEEDVKREAEILGYASLFTGGIYGAVGDIKVEPKKDVLSRIVEGIDTAEGSTIITFGDGPVEIRETKKAGGCCVGIASNEIRRYGLDKKKRERLILAGADLIIPDFSFWHLLADLLFTG